MVEAHQKAVEVIIERDGVPVKELADMAIVSGGGYPKDINLYQSTKPMVNAAGGLKDHGIMILRMRRGTALAMPTWKKCW